MAMPLENHAFEPQFYSRRNPSAYPFWKIVAAHYDEFERVYPERYGAKYGFYRPAMRIAADKFIKGSIKNNLGICWRIFRIDYHGAKEESRPRRESG